MIRRVAADLNRVPACAGPWLEVTGQFLAREYQTVGIR